MKTPLCSVLFATLLLGAPVALRADDPPPETPARDNAPHYPLRGIVETLAPAKGMILVKYETVPGLMDASTLGFRVKPAVFHLVKTGQTITATLIVREDDFYLEDVKVVKSH